MSCPHHHQKHCCRLVIWVVLHSLYCASDRRKVKPTQGGRTEEEHPAKPGRGRSASALVAVSLGSTGRYAAASIEGADGADGEDGISGFQVFTSVQDFGPGGFGGAWCIAPEANAADQVGG